MLNGQQLHKLALSCSIALGTVLSVPSAHSGFDTSHIVSTTMEQLTDCLDYRILGLSYRVIWTPYGPYYFWTLHVGHTVPAMVNQSHPYLDKMPWEDMASLLGSSYASSSANIIRSAFGLDVEVGAGRHRHHQFGDHYAPQHYESTIAGHPLMIVFQKTQKQMDTNSSTGGGGSGTANSRYFQGTGNIAGSGSNNNSDGQNFIGSWGLGSGTPGNWSNDQRDSMNYDATMNQIDNADYKQYDETTDHIASQVDSYGVSTGNSYYCKLPYTPFWPYYLSGLDSSMWRRGFPFVDMHKIFNMLLPGPKIGPTVGVTLPEVWGHLYPRYGVVNHVDDAKGSAVIASRGLDILIDPQIGRVYWPMTKPNGVAWSKLYPEPVSCHKKIGNTGAHRDDDRQYAWTNWFYARCDLDESGMLVFRIEFPEPIQVTPEIPE